MAFLGDLGEQRSCILSSSCRAEHASLPLSTLWKQSLDALINTQSLGVIVRFGIAGAFVSFSRTFPVCRRFFGSFLQVRGQNGKRTMRRNHLDSGPESCRTMSQRSIGG